MLVMKRAEPESMTHSGILPSKEGDAVRQARPMSGPSINQSDEKARSPSTTSALHQLKSPPRTFAGRTIELQELRETIQAGGIVIRGRGGIGKTALARKLAQELTPQYPDAQFELDLQGTEPRPLTSDQVMRHIILSYDLQAKLPEDPSALPGLYHSVLHGQRSLLLLDNAAGREQVEPIIPPDSCLLVITSRHRFTLPGLLPKDLDYMDPEDAKDLLVRISPRINEHATALAELCGCLPFALCKAGSVLADRSDLSTEEYLRRLRENKAKLDLINASISLSYQLMPSHLQRLWLALAVFPGTFDVQAAAAVWGMGLDESQDCLGALFTRSLVEWDQKHQRYRLHDLDRVYAGTSLEETGTGETVCQNHAAHFRDVLDLSGQLYLKGGHDVLGGLAMLDREWGNIQAGQAWAADRAGENGGAAALCSAYPDAGYPGAGMNVLDLRMHPQDKIRWLEAALAAARSLKDQAWEGRHLGNLGIAYTDLDQHRLAIGYLEQALRIGEDCDPPDSRIASTALFGLGLAHEQLGNHSMAVEHHTRALEIARDRLERRSESANLYYLGCAYQQQGQPGQAIELHQQALTIAREIGDRWREGAVLTRLGLAYCDLGQPNQAIECLNRALAIDREIRDRQGEGADLNYLGVAHATLGQLQQAIQFHEESLTISREIRDRRGEGTAWWNMALVLDRLGKRLQAITSAEDALQVFQQIEHPSVPMVQQRLVEWRRQEEKE
jgi:tetratricopeptide (TPR) repeat protein